MRRPGQPAHKPLRESMYIAKSLNMLHDFKLSDGRQLAIRETLADTPSRWWVVFLPGSAAEFWDLDWIERRSLFQHLPTAVNLLVINKPGISQSGRVHHATFEKSFRRSTRIQDYREVLRALVPRGHNILVMGFSEGAYLAPDVILGDRRVRALALICGGTRSWIDEEIYKMTLRETPHVLRRVSAIYARPESTRLSWHGISHPAWISYDNDNTVLALEKLRLPILAIQADRDRMIDVKSAIEDLERIRQNFNPQILIRMLKGVDHTLGHKWPRTLSMISHFFAKNMVKAKSRDQVKRIFDPSQATR